MRFFLNLLVFLQETYHASDVQNCERLHDCPPSLFGASRELPINEDLPFFDMIHKHPIHGRNLQNLIELKLAKPLDVNRAPKLVRLVMEVRI